MAKNQNLPSKFVVKSGLNGRFTSLKSPWTCEITMKLYSFNWSPGISLTSQVEQFRQIFIRWARYDPMHGLSSRECPGCDEIRSKPQKLQMLDGLLGGGFNFFYFHPYLLGKMNPFWRLIFFKGVGSTTNQFILSAILVGNHGFQSSFCLA